MYQIGVAIIISFFITLLFLNFYFRVKVLKHYKTLVRNKVQFDAKLILNKVKIEQEVLPKYPKHKEAILAFTGNIRKSIGIAIVLIILISIMAVFLMKMK